MFCVISLIFANKHPRAGKAKSCKWLGTKEKRKEKGKGKEVEREDMEMAEALAEVKKLTGVVRALKGEVQRLGRGYQRMRRAMRE